jgi:immunoglobulin-binding protein 1
VDYTLAELKNRSYGNDRLAALKQSSELLENFLTNVDHYGLLTSTDRKLYERYLESRTSFRVISSTNPEEKRKIKIGRFQEEKTLKQKLEVSPGICHCATRLAKKSSISEMSLENLTLTKRRSETCT